MAMGEYLNTKGVKSLYLMAPTMPPARTCLAGVRRTYKGKIIGEDFTKWPDQLDFSAELARSPPPSLTASSSSIPARTAFSS